MIPSSPHVRWTTSTDDVQIAYEVVGEGPSDVVFALGLLPSVEMSREVSFLRRWLERLSGVARVAHYDRRGVGLSDRDLPIGPPEGRMDDIRSVMDAAGMAKASIVTSVDGGPIALMFAATHPDRVDRLVLYESWARVRWAPDFPAGHKVHTLSAHAAEHWGDGTTFGLLVGDPWDPPTAQAILARLERTNSTPAMAARHFHLAQVSDVRSILSSVRCPTQVLVRSELDALTPIGRALAEQLGTTAVELPGRWLHSWRDDYEDEALDAVTGFLLADHGRPPPVVGRVLQTLLLTDIVDSTAELAERGDGAWRSLLDRHDAVVREAVAQQRGRVVSHTGDGVLAAFDGPARAVTCAAAISRSVQPLGIRVRTGLHSGECEQRGDDLAGIAVHLAARVCAVAGPEEVLVTSTVRDLVSGSDLRFESRGLHELKGIDEPRHLYRLVGETPGPQGRTP